jgi:hypothetical protein
MPPARLGSQHFVVQASTTYATSSIAGNGGRVGGVAKFADFAGRSSHILETVRARRGFAEARRTGQAVWNVNERSERVSR